MVSQRQVAWLQGSQTGSARSCNGSLDDAYVNVNANPSRITVSNFTDEIIRSAWTDQATRVRHQTLQVIDLLEVTV